MNLRFFDQHHQNIAEFDEMGFGHELDNLKRILEVHLEKLDTINDYKLESFQVTLGVKAGTLVIGVDGGLSLNFSRPKPQ